MRAPFDAVVTAHGATVLRVCRAVLGPGADADDAWSETFLSALRSWPELPESTNVEAWLVRVAHRRAVDVVRRHARLAVPAGAADDLTVLAGWDVATGRGYPGGAAGGPAGSRVDDDEVGDPSIWDAVAVLPARQRVCVAYRYLGGLSYAEIADLAGGSEAAARRAAADGIAALRRRLGAADGQSRNGRTGTEEERT